MKFFTAKIICIAGCLALFASPAIAEESFPAFPMAFYGEASLNNELLSKDTKIQVYSDNILVGEVIMLEKGVYGYNSPIKSKLIVDIHVIYFHTIYTLL